MSRRGWVLFAAMGVIWGVPYLLIKVAVDELAPSTLVLARTALASLLLLPVALARGRLPEVARAWRPLLAFAVIEIMAPWLLLGVAEQQLSSSLTGLLIAAVPLVGAVLAVVTGSDDRLDGRRLAGLLLGFAGVAALVGFEVGGGDVGAVLALAAGRGLLRRRPADPVPLAVRTCPGLGVITASLAAHGGGLPAGRAGPGAVVLAERRGRAGRHRPRGALHRHRVPGVLRADRRGRPDPVDGHHLRQPGGRRAARRARCWTSRSPSPRPWASSLILAGSVLATRRATPPGRPTSASPRSAWSPSPDRRCRLAQPPDLRRNWRLVTSLLSAGRRRGRRGGPRRGPPCCGPAWPPAPRASCAARRSRPSRASCAVTVSPVLLSWTHPVAPRGRAAPATRVSWATIAGGQPVGVAAAAGAEVMHRASPALRMLPSSTITVGTSAAFSVPRSRRTSSPSPPYAVETAEAGADQAGADPPARTAATARGCRRSSPSRSPGRITKKPWVAAAAPSPCSEISRSAPTLAPNRPRVPTHGPQSSVAVGRPGQPDGRAERLEPALQGQRRPPGERGLGEAAVGRGAGGVARLPDARPRPAG